MWPKLKRSTISPSGHERRWHVGGEGQDTPRVDQLTRPSQLKNVALSFFNGGPPLPAKTEAFGARGGRRCPSSGWGVIRSKPSFEGKIEPLAASRSPTGADTRLIQDYLGHRNIQHTVKYTATNPARFQQLWQ